MPTPLTDAHLAILRAAADRSDALLTPPDRLLGAARSRMTAGLIARGVVVPITIAANEPRWLVEADGSTIGLQLTEAGRDAASAGAAQGVPQPEAAGNDETSPSEAVDHASDTAPAPRLGSKAALLLDLVSRDGGASLDVLGNALGWQPHTVRAALTRLRQGGAPVERVTGEDGRSVYRVTTPAEPQIAGLTDTAGARDGAA